MPAQLESPSKKAFGNMMLPSEEVIAPKADTGSGKSAVLDHIFEMHKVELI